MSDFLTERYGAFFAQGQKVRVDAGEPAVAQLRPSKVPEDLWPLIPYAEFWGIADDSYRTELIKQAPAEIWSGFRAAVSEHELRLLDWLAGPEADLPPTPEYVAFSFMLRAFCCPRE